MRPTSWLLLALALIGSSLAHPDPQYNVSPDLPAPSAVDADDDSGISNDPDCLELDALKSYLCNTDKCKDFYTKGCTDPVNGKAPTCTMIKKCTEDRIEHYKNKAEKKHLGNSAGSFSMSLVLILASAIFVLKY